ncbi:MAG: prepilin-type N-terminal cleavage/methylation domain-containing protein [Phycisphaerales bacterium JB065]
MTVSLRNQGLTLVETLAALALLSMLVAATSALTSHITSVSADRQKDARAHIALAAVAELIAFDLDCWAISHEKAEPPIPLRELITVSPTEIEFRFPKQDQHAERTIRYRFNEASGVLTRSDSEYRSGVERVVGGELNQFEIVSSADLTTRSDAFQNLTIQLTSATKERQTVTVRLPAPESTDD